MRILSVRARVDAVRELAARVESLAASDVATGLSSSAVRAGLAADALDIARCGAFERMALGVRYVLPLRESCNG